MEHNVQCSKVITIQTIKIMKINKKDTVDYNLDKKLISRELISKLKSRKSVMFFEVKRKYFHKFQINKKEKNICWERYVSLDRMNWVKWNEYLGLKDVLSCIENVKKNKI